MNIIGKLGDKTMCCIVTRPTCCGAPMMPPPMFGCCMPMMPMPMFSPFMNMGCYMPGANFAAGMGYGVGVGLARGLINLIC